MSSALDRQIRPIYDALDTGSNKSALVACNKILKKHPKNELAKALKALALVRSQKVEEALVVCDEVLAAKPTNDAVLSAMMHVLRGLGRQNDLVSMFEEAYKQQPGNEDLAGQTFFANVRAGHWKVAQQLATKMHKQFQDDRYVYWSVISAILQANDSSTPPAMATVLYQLSHRLITSSPTPSYHSGDRFYLHLCILRKLSLFDEARKLLDSPVGRAICSTNLYCDEVRREISRLSGHLLEEYERARQLIAEANDRNWLEFMSILDYTFVEPSQVSERIADTMNLFQEVATNDGAKDRSGLLALLELEKRCRAHSASDDPSRMVFLMSRYFNTFGHKAVCFEDLKPFLALPDADLSAWTAFLDSIPPSFASLNDLQRLTNSHKLLRFNLRDEALSIDAELSRGNLYIKHYIQGLALGNQLASTELQPADDLAILAANTFINIWCLTRDQKYIYQAAIILEFALTKSKQSFQSRLILIRIYRILGAPLLALEHYRSLGVKQVQNDTLSHFIISRSSTFSLAAIGDLTFATECLEASQIYISNAQETSEYVIRAFMQEKYSQIPEFISFDDRLENSLQRDLIKMEHLRMRLAHEVINSDIIDMELIELKFIFDRQHHDNRDFAILPNYQPHSTPSLGDQTLLLGKSAGLGWLYSFLKVYIRALQQGSDLDDTVEEKLLIGDRPKLTPEMTNGRTLKERLVDRPEAELAELTSDEQALIRYSDALADWLEPYHNHVRPPPALVLAEAAKQNDLKIGHPIRGLELNTSNSSSTNGKKDEEAPAFKEPPEVIQHFFDDLKLRFEVAKQGSDSVEVLHVAGLLQEALLIFIVETLRFKAGAVVKVHKLSALVGSIKTLRSKIFDITRSIAAEVQIVEDIPSSLTDACVLEAVPEIDRDFVSVVVKKVSDDRKKVVEGFGKGMARVCTLYSK